MSVIILQDEVVHYEVLGRGRPLLFIHGWVGSWRYWVPTMQAASLSFRAYAIDLWGFGDTAKNPDRYSLEVQTTLLNEFMEKMGIGKIALVGHGLGSVVALNFACQHPDLVDRVIAVGYPLDETMLNPRLGSSSPADLAEWLLARTPGTENTRIEAQKADSQAMQTSLDDLRSLDLMSFSRSLATPCLFVHGQNDAAVNPPTLDEITALPEHTHHILFDQSGHFPMLDENNKFNRLMADFLALPSGESPRQLQLKEEWKRRVR